MSKVLILVPDIFCKGGIERYVRYQYKALQMGLGAENVYLFTLAPPKVGNTFEEDIHVTYVGGGLSLRSKLRYAWDVLRFVRKYKISLIISAHLKLSIIAYLVKLLFGIPYITNVYGLEVWGDLKGRDRLGLLKSNKLIGDCHFILEYVRKNFNFKGASFLLHDPVEMGHFKPMSVPAEFLTQYKIPSNVMKVMTVGRLERNKGHKVMIEVLSSLPDDVIYVIVGGGFMDTELKQLVSSKGLSNRVIFTGRIPENDLVLMYNVADVVLLLSTFGNGEGEGLPLGLIEGAACAKPILCGNEDGSAEAYNPKDPNGYLVSPLDSGSILKALNEYRLQPNLREQHGNAGRHFIEENFNFISFKKKICELVLDSTISK